MPSLVSLTVTVPRMQPIQMGFVPQLLGFFFAARLSLTAVAFQSDPSAGSAVINVCGLLLVGAVWIVSGSKPWRVPRGLARWVLVYALFIGASVLWSVAKSPGTAAVYWAGVFADIVAIHLLVKDGNAEGIAYDLMEGYVWGAIALGLVAWSLPTMWDLRIGNEDFLHPNLVGYTSALGLLFALQLLRRSRLMLFCALFCGATLLRSLSKGSIAALLAAGTYYVVRGSHLRRRTKILIGIVAAAAIAGSWALMESYIDTYSSTYQLETLTGRTYLWAIAWDESFHTFWFGHGLYSFRFVIPSIGDFQPWHAHNEYLQQFFCFGLVGFALYVGLHIRVVRTLWRNRAHEFATLGGAVLILALVRGFVDTENISINYPLWLMTLFAFVFRDSTKRNDSTENLDRHTVL
jgi:exopolysaccharide production protein ExoQ